MAFLGLPTKTIGDLCTIENQAKLTNPYLYTNGFGNWCLEIFALGAKGKPPSWM